MEQNPNHTLITSPSPSPSPSPSRLWRPAAQRNLRNQWSSLHSGKVQWAAAASEGRSHATSVVNAHLSQRYVPAMDLGVLKDMPGIRHKACEKLALKEELCRSKLLSSYKDMVAAVSHLGKASSSMRCYLKGSATSPLLQFCEHPADTNDPGDGGGNPVFSSLSILDFENLAQEVVGMFKLELTLKRLLMVELLAITNKKETPGETKILSKPDELYPGEFDDLRTNDMLSKESFQAHPPQIKGWQPSDSFTAQSRSPPSHEVLQVYITTWLADVNIDKNRIDEIFAMVEEEMQVKLS